MSPFLIGLIMIAALLHATWNAIIKLGGDRLIIMALLSGSSGLIGLRRGLAALLVLSGIILLAL